MTIQGGNEMMTEFERYIISQAIDRGHTVFNRDVTLEATRLVGVPLKKLKAHIREVEPLLKDVHFIKITMRSYYSGNTTLTITYDAQRIIDKYSAAALIQPKQKK